jgi:hypothetical protein
MASYPRRYVMPFISLKSKLPTNLMKRYKYNIYNSGIRNVYSKIITLP